MTAEVMTAVVTGNTTPVTNFRGRSFQFTLNQVEKYDALVAELKKLKTCTYLISCREIAPNTQHEHIHIYCHFNQTYKLSKKILSFGAHVEICKGSPKQNIAYVEKDGNIIEEYGTRPSQGCRTVAELKEMSVEDVSPQYYRIKNEIDRKELDKKIFQDMLREIQNDQLKAPEIIYITGPSGKGKTYSAYKIALENYPLEKIGKLTLNNNFIDITNEEAECFVIEEFRDSQIRASDFLQLTDKYGYRCNIKGGFFTLRPKMIIICSIKDPSDIYHDEINQQFLRRCTRIIRMNEDQISL